MPKTMISLIVVAALALPVQRAQAQAAQTAQAAIAACQASPVACVVVGASAGVYLYWKYGQQLFCPTYGTGCRPTTPGAMPEPSQHRLNEPGKQEVHAVASPDLCKKLAAKFEMQRRNLKLKGVRRTTNPMLRYDCIFMGPDAQEGWFAERRYR